MSKYTQAQLLQLANNVSSEIIKGDSKTAVEMLKPLLNDKCAFSKLDLLGKQIGQRGIGHTKAFFDVFDEIIDYQAMGGFVVVGQALSSFLETDFEEALQKSRDYIVKGDKWFVCDIIGERILGQAVINYFAKVQLCFIGFLDDNNRWVRRSVGVAIHFWAKRVQDYPERAATLLKLIEPYIEEKNFDAVKGIGWSLKTIGKYYPTLLEPFLREQIKKRRKIRKLMIRKALTYLTSEQKKSIEAYARTISS